MRMSVIGTGYLGATHAAGMAEAGHEVLGVDVDPARVAALAAGEAPFHEPGLPELLCRHVASGRLRFSTDPAEAAGFARLHFIAVGTPQVKGSHAADVRQLDAAVAELVPRLRGEHVLLGKSTVPVGTAARLQDRADELAAAGAAVEVGWNPEFLREGRAVADTLRPDRLVLGVDPDRGGAAEAAARECYAPQLAAGIPLLVLDRPTAELVKVAANAFLATKISFINAVAEVCEAAGADVVELSRALGLDPRIGARSLHAGLGYGGGCLPKDVRAFMHRAGELGADQALALLREVDAINVRRREKVVGMVKAAFGGLARGRRVAVLGAAFKPDSDDVRDSPALSIAGQLALAGAEVRVHDPEAMGNARRVFPTLDYRGSVEEAVAGAELVVVATEWRVFRELDPAAVGALVAERRVLDARNCLDAAAWRAAGWQVTGLGR